MTCMTSWTGLLSASRVSSGNISVICAHVQGCIQGRSGKSRIAQLAHRSGHCFYCIVKHCSTSACLGSAAMSAGDARQAAQTAVRYAAVARMVLVKEGYASRGGRRGGRPFVKEEIKTTGQALHCVGARLVALWRRARHALGRAANLPTSFAMCAALAGAQRGVCARQPESCERALL